MKFGKYTPAQVAKALSAALVSVVGILTLAAASFTDGDLAVVGAWATAALLVVNPIVVFLQKTAPWIAGGFNNVNDALNGDTPGSSGGPVA